ncbi:aKG-HExxH-type peptide beta-hydroxylase [Dactylosporangium sp. CA-233914]|uniref:aKG-HExxH-type peptide beta-hydroxylase n=1 Tax=Dactylosporangium sp. CA-233914 TaxID=3239934 RepID=UPI003D8F7656
MTKHILLIRQAAHLARTRPGLAEPSRALAEAEPHAHTLLAYPLIGAWAIRCLTAGRAADLNHLHGVAAAATLAAGREITWPLPAGTHIPAAGPHRLRAGSQMLHLDDADPYRDVFDLPLSPRLSPAQAAAWRTATAEAGELLATHHPWHARSMARCLSAVVPLASPGRSATSRDAFGAAALALPEDSRRLAAGLVHEQQHAKLNALLFFHDLLRPGALPGRYYAPWRTDPRPAGALLHGCYAHLAIADFWRTEFTRTEDETAAFEFDRWRLAVTATAETLAASGTLSPAGTRLVSGMRARLAAWHGDTVPRTAHRRALAALEAHRDEHAVA